MTIVAQHLSKTNEHYTPAHIVDYARFLMGGIDLDPASCNEANRTVNAGRYLTIADDGLSAPWNGRVFLNPPGGKLKRDPGACKWIPIKDGPGESSMRVWWQYLCDEYESGCVTQAFFVAFTLEILRTSQQGTPAQRFMRCYPSDRIKFGGAPSPTHANVLIHMPPRYDGKAVHRSAFERFSNIFAPIGYCEPGSIA